MSRLKLVLGLAGLLMALAGIALEAPAVVWAAMAILGTSVVIRSVLAIRARRAEREEEQPPG